MRAFVFSRTFMQFLRNFPRVLPHGGLLRCVNMRFFLFYMQPFSMRAFYMRAFCALHRKSRPPSCRSYSFAFCRACPCIKKQAQFCRALLSKYMQKKIVSYTIDDVAVSCIIVWYFRPRRKHRTIWMKFSRTICLLTIMTASRDIF